MNQNLKQLLEQLVQTWKQLGLNQRVTIVAATGIVIAGLSALAFWSNRPDYVLLYGKLSDADTASIITELESAKIPYQTSRAGSSILVPSDKVHQIRAQLATKGVPRGGDGVGFEIFEKPSFGITDFLQRVNYIRAVQGELARTIAQIDQVDSARVMIVMPENRLLVDAQKKPTASVFVRIRGNGQLPSSSVNSIRFLVANAVEGLSINNVSVVDNLGNVLSENQEDDSVAGLSNNQLTARRNLEQYLSRQTEGMLDRVLGPGQAVVRVAADINWDTVTRTEEKFDPDGQVLRTSTLDDETTTSTTGEANGGATGIAGNTADAAAAPPTTSPQNSSQTKKKVQNNQFEINKTTVSTLLSAGSLRRLSAAVFVAQKFEGTGADRKAVPRTPEELQKLRRIVQSALGLVESDPSRKDEITLEELPFNEQPAIEMSQRLESDTNRSFYWEIGKNVLFAGLALMMFMVFLKLLKKTTASDIPVGPAFNPATAPGALDAGQEDGGTLGQWRKESKPSVVTVDVLNALIKENPANMTQAVRTWLAGGQKSN